MEGSPQHDKFQSRSQELIRGEPSRAAKNFDKTIPRRGSNEPTIVKTIALQSFALVVMLGAAWLAQGPGCQSAVFQHGPA
jgi:hypothetical protein